MAFGSYEKITNGVKQNPATSGRRCRFKPILPNFDDHRQNPANAAGFQQSETKIRRS
jgi:hypothetical protein